MIRINYIKPKLQSEFRSMLLILFAFCLLDVYAQKSSIAIELGVNQSSFTIFPEKKDFNIHANIGINLDIKLKKRLFLETGLLRRNVGSIDYIPITSSQAPDSISGFEKLFYGFKQLTIPTIFNYSFGNKIYIKPCLGLNYTYNFAENAKFRGQYIKSYIAQKFTVNCVGGLIVQKQDFIKKKFGLGCKFSFEYGLIDVGRFFPIKTFGIFNLTVLGSYTIK